MALQRSAHRMAQAMRFAFILIFIPLLSACGESPDRLVIETAQGKQHSFTVEWALTEEQRAIGLMGRREMAADHGMLFDFGTPQEVTMWMKNTPLSLDMLFIREDGRIHRIESNTEPMSLRVIYSGDYVRYVLEIPGGAAEANGIKAGDRIISPMVQGGK